MRTVNVYAAALFAAIAFLTSCKTSTDFSNEIRVADSVKAQLVKAATDFSHLDSQRVNTARTTIEAYLGWVTANLKDTIDRRDAVTLSNFKQVNKSLGKYARTKKDLQRNYAHNVKQLDDLIYDLKNGHITSKDSARKYVMSESEANRMLTLSLSQHAGVIPEELKKYDSLKPHVENFIQRVNNGTIPPDLLKAGDKPIQTEEDD